MDRRNLNLENNFRCIQSKNLLMHWDLEKLDPIALRHAKHLQECTACSEAQKKLNEKSIELNLQIPRPIMALESKQSFINEVDEVFNRLEFSKKQQSKKRVKSSLTKINDALKSFSDVLFSRNMLSVYGFGLFTYIVLAKIL